MAPKSTLARAAHSPTKIKNPSKLIYTPRLEGGNGGSTRNNSQNNRFLLSSQPEIAILSRQNLTSTHSALGL